MTAFWEDSLRFAFVANGLMWGLWALACDVLFSVAKELLSIIVFDKEVRIWNIWFHFILFGIIVPSSFTQYNEFLVRISLFDKQYRSQMFGIWIK